MLQTVLSGYRGMVVEICPGRNEAICRLWNQSGLPEVWSFADQDAARLWAEREFAIPPAAWMVSDRSGSQLSMIDVLRSLSRVFTCNEMCAAVAIAYNTVALDKDELRVFPTDESCLTSFNVVSDLPDTLDWIREGCTLFPLHVTNGYGLVADLSYHLPAVEASPEYEQIKRALSDGAGIVQWLPQEAPPEVWAYRVPEASGPLAGVINQVIALDSECPDSVMSAYEAETLGVASGVQLVRTKRRGFELREKPYLSRMAEVAVAGGTPHLILKVTRETSEWVWTTTWYRTTADGVLRQAARRLEREPFVDVALDDALEEFESEAQAWREWTEPAPPAPPPPAQLAWDRELERLLATAESLNDDSDAIFDLAKQLQQRGVFIAEHMSGGPPHVVKRLVIAAVRRLMQGPRDSHTS